MASRAAWIFAAGLVLVSMAILLSTWHRKQILYSFFVAGHTYGVPSASVPHDGLHGPFRDRFELIRSDRTMELGVLTGDIVWTSTIGSWDRVDEDVASLGVPVHFAVGNHDITDRSLYEKRYGRTYYSFVHRNDLFIVLDPNLDHWRIGAAQLEFIRDSLANAAGVDNILVFFHQLIWLDQRDVFRGVLCNSLEGRSEDVNFWTEVEPLFRAMDRPVYMFAGDVGAFPQHVPVFYKDGNICLIASGMGGMQNDNFLVVEVLRDKSIRIRLVALNGDNVDAMGNIEDYVVKSVRPGR